MTTSGLRTEYPAEGVALLTLDRPKVLNAIDLALARRLDEELARLEGDSAIRAIVITGAGDRAFSAGYDIHEMNGFNADQMLAAFMDRDPLIWRVASHPKPILTALNGVTYGAGALIAAAADIRVGGPRTQFLVTATKYGGANATWTLPAIVGMAKAKEILMTGRAVPAEEMREIGLLNQLVPDDEILARTIEMAKLIASHPTTGVQWIKKLVNDGVGRSYADQFGAENFAMATAMRPEAGNAVFSAFGQTSKAKG